MTRFQQSARVSSDNFNSDGRRRDGLYFYHTYQDKIGLRIPGCYTCKRLRKKKCDCCYTFDETTGTQKCNTCTKHGIDCYLTEPAWASDPEQAKAHQDERKRQVKLKRKARDESISSGRTSRDRSATLRPAEFPVHQSSLVRSIETGFSDHYSSSMTRQSVPLRKGMATFGGKGGFKYPRH